MICYYLNEDLTTHHTADEEPVHGEDFCDSCGDCLSCYGDDRCTGTKDGTHFWVKYHEDWNEEW